MSATSALARCARSTPAPAGGRIARRQGERQPHRRQSRVDWCLGARFDVGARASYVPATTSPATQPATSSIASGDRQAQGATGRRLAVSAVKLAFTSFAAPHRIVDSPAQHRREHDRAAAALEHAFPLGRPGIACHGLAARAHARRFRGPAAAGWGRAWLPGASGQPPAARHGAVAYIERAELMTSWPGILIDPEAARATGSRTSGWCHAPVPGTPGRTAITGDRRTSSWRKPDERAALRWHQLAESSPALIWRGSTIASAVE